MHKQLRKRIDYRKIGDKFGAGASTACKKVNTAGTEENLFRLVPVLGHGARVLHLELVLLPGHGAQFVLGHQQKAMFRLVFVPGHCGRAPSLNGA